MSLVEHPTWLTSTGAAVILEIVVDSTASRTRLMGTSSGRLKIQLSSCENHDAINQAIIRFLGKILGVSTAQIEVIAGAAKSKKRVCISRVSRTQVLLKLSPRAQSL